MVGEGATGPTGPTGPSGPPGVGATGATGPSGAASTYPGRRTDRSRWRDWTGRCGQHRRYRPDRTDWSGPRDSISQPDLLRSHRRQRQQHGPFRHIRRGISDDNEGALSSLDDRLRWVCRYDPDRRRHLYGFIDRAGNSRSGGCRRPSDLGQHQQSWQVVVSTTSATVITLESGARCHLQAFEIRTSTTGNGVTVPAGSTCHIHTDMRFGPIAQAALQIEGGYVRATGNYSVVGNMQRRVYCRRNGIVHEEFRTITYSGTPVFSSANVESSQGGLVTSAASTQSGSATGKRYTVGDAASMISTGGGGANFYPGDPAGRGRATRRASRGVPRLHDLTSTRDRATYSAALGRVDTLVESPLSVPPVQRVLYFRGAGPSCGDRRMSTGLPQSRRGPV
jgi:hypothetical protein